MAPTPSLFVKTFFLSQLFAREMDTMSNPSQPNVFRYSVSLAYRGFLLLVGSSHRMDAKLQSNHTGSPEVLRYYISRRTVSKVFGTHFCSLTAGITPETLCRTAGS